MIVGAKPTQAILNYITDNLVNVTVKGRLLGVYTLVSTFKPNWGLNQHFVYGGWKSKDTRMVVRHFHKWPFIARMLGVPLLGMAAKLPDPGGG